METTRIQGRGGEAWEERGGESKVYSFHCPGLDSRCGSYCRYHRYLCPGTRRGGQTNPHPHVRNVYRIVRIVSKYGMYCTVLGAGSTPPMRPWIAMRHIYVQISRYPCIHPYTHLYLCACILSMGMCRCIHMIRTYIHLHARNFLASRVSFAPTRSWARSWVYGTLYTCLLVGGV